MMVEISNIGFQTGMLIAGSVAFVGYLVGLCINLLIDFGRG